jgi:hypothetical protein
MKTIFKVMFFTTCITDTLNVITLELTPRSWIFSLERSVPPWLSLARLKDLSSAQMQRALYE